MHVSIIISTYNSPAWLQKVLWGYSVQDDRDFEVILADDGSNALNRFAIEEVIQSAPFPIRHLWQPDEGFRKTLILNKAIRAASHNYLIFTDGDCIPRFDFVSTHKRHAAKNRFLSGGYLKLPLGLSRSITQLDVISGRIFEIDWLRANGLPSNRKNAKVSVGKLGRILDRLTPTPRTFNGQNSSAWKSDILRVNGFDNRMAYGGEDSELGLRLKNNGINGKQIRYSAICVHLDHQRGYVSPEGLQFNEKIRRNTRRLKKTWTESGLQQIPLPPHFEAASAESDKHSLPTLSIES